MRFSRENVEKLLADGSFFWVDVDQPVDADYEVLREVFKSHPLANTDGADICVPQVLIFLASRIATLRCSERR